LPAGLAARPRSRRRALLSDALGNVAIIGPRVDRAEHLKRAAQMLIVRYDRSVVRQELIGDDYSIRSR
jgi:hypothetical protein